MRTSSAMRRERQRERRRGRARRSRSRAGRGDVAAERVDWDIWEGAPQESDQGIHDDEKGAPTDCEGSAEALECESLVPTRGIHP